MDSLWRHWDALLILALAVLVARRLPRPAWWTSYVPPSWWRAWHAPLLLGIITALATAWAWGSLNPILTIHDEQAYLLQAAMLAQGRFAGPPAPLPAFFEQFHVFVTPVLAARYPPGFALALVPGVILGLPALVPVLLTGLTAALLYGLVRRLRGAAEGFVAWAIWILAPMGIHFRTTLLSEQLTEFLWLGGWWCLLEWRREHRTRWLIGLGIAIGWCAITRPLTAIAFVIPIGVVLAVDLWRRRDLRPGLTIFAAALPFVALIPWQNRAVTGQWTVTPLAQYSRVYFPFDRPGFGLDSTPPERPLPPDFQAFAEFFRPQHVGYTVGALPGVFRIRVERFLQGIGRLRTPAFTVLAAIGLAAGGAELWFAAGSVVLLLVLYLDFAHPVNWTVYYLEGHGPVAALVAVGAAWCTRWLARRTERPGGQGRSGPLHARSALVLFGAWMLVQLPGTLRRWHNSIRDGAEPIAVFLHAVDTIPGKAIVFVRYAPQHNFHLALVTNPPDYGAARVWIVRDRGAEDARLAALAPERTTYLYVEEEHRLSRFTPSAP